MNRKVLKVIAVHAVVWVIAIVLGVYGVLLAYVGLQQGSYVYFPGEELLTPPDAEGLYEALTVVTADGERLGCWFVPAVTEGARPVRTILLCHGNAGTRADRWYFVKHLSELGFHVMIFDYRGYADSTGTPSERGTYRDVEAVWKELVERRGTDPGDIILYGRSLGAAVASWLAVRTEPRALIMEGAFSSAVDMAREMFPWLPVTLLSRFSYDNAARMPALDCPVVIAHTRSDHAIPFAHGERLFAAARPPRRFVELTGAHCDDSALYHAGFRALIKELSDAESFTDEGWGY